MYNSFSLSGYIKDLGTQLQTLESWELNESLEQLRSTYSYMLGFLVKGIEDPNTKDLQLQLWTKAIALQHRISRLKRTKENPRCRYAVALQSLRPDSELPNLLMRMEQPYDPSALEDCMVKLFRRVWTSDQWQNADYEQAMQMLQSDMVPDKAKGVLISAVLMALLEYFDSRKLTFLLDAYLTDDCEISQRALVSIILTLQKDYELLDFHSEIKSRLSILFDDDTFVENAYTAMIQLQMSAQTEEVSNKIREDIMPAILKGSTMMKREMGVVEINNKLSENGENPEWIQPDESLDNKAREKMREMVDMQINGEDVYMATFWQMKNNKFFNEIAHWFYPFTDDDPALKNCMEYFNNRSGTVLKTMLRLSPLCDNDKYSLCLLTTILDRPNLQSLASHIEAQMENLEKEDSLEMMLQHKPTTRQCSRNFIFGLYRFFHLYGFRSEFYNPFEDAEDMLFSPMDIPALRGLASHKQLLMEHADFLMRRGYYAQAFAEFELYMKTGKHSAELFQKMGFCDQKLKIWSEAQEYYERADSIKPDSKWTLAHLGKAYLMQRNYAKALECYQQTSDMEPENAVYLLRQAECLWHMGQIPAAIELLYKANYLDADSERIRNMLGFCLILNQEYAKGISFFSNPLDKGVACIAAGQATEAYANLKQAQAEDQNFVRHFYNTIEPYCEQGALTALQAELYLDACMTDLSS